MVTDFHNLFVPLLSNLLATCDGQGIVSTFEVVVKTTKERADLVSEVQEFLFTEISFECSTEERSECLTGLWADQTSIVNTSPVVDKRVIAKSSVLLTEPLHRLQSFVCITTSSQIFAVFIQLVVMFGHALVVFEVQELGDEVVEIRIDLVLRLRRPIKSIHHVLVNEFFREITKARSRCDRNTGVVIAKHTAIDKVGFETFSEDQTVAVFRNTDSKAELNLSGKLRILLNTRVNNTNVVGHGVVVRAEVSSTHAALHSSFLDTESLNLVELLGTLTLKHRHAQVVPVVPSAIQVSQVVQITPQACCQLIAVWRVG